MKWNEGRLHVAMRTILAAKGWDLIAGEYPGGSDHDLYPLNVVDPEVARDRSPDPRRHSQGELIPDLVALRGKTLIIAEAKVRYDEKDYKKLMDLITIHRCRLLQALSIFAQERNCPQLCPIENLEFCPTLVFASESKAPPPSLNMSYLRIFSTNHGVFEGKLRLETIR
ncbi:hypothetical protein GM609_09300 [Bombella sp. ESL0387]|nr:hypothetical protein [Bombella sp. ESL0387]